MLTDTMLRALHAWYRKDKWVKALYDAMDADMSGVDGKLMQDYYNLFFDKLDEDGCKVLEKDLGLHPAKAEGPFQGPLDGGAGGQGGGRAPDAEGGGCVARARCAGCGGQSRGLQKRFRRGRWRQAYLVRIRFPLRSAGGPSLSGRAFLVAGCSG